MPYVRCTTLRIRLKKPPHEAEWVAREKFHENSLLP